MSDLENRTFDEIQVGETATLTRTLRQEDIELFAVMSGDVNPAHLDEEYARSEIFHKVIAHGMWGGALISSILGTSLPGPGTIYLGQTLKFLRPVGLGDEVTVTVTALEKDEKKKIIIFECLCANQDGNAVITGTAKVLAPSEKIIRKRPELPEVLLHDSGSKLRAIIQSAEGLPPVKTAVAHPVHDYSLAAVVDAHHAGLIDPILVGPEERIRAAAKNADLDISAFPIIETNHSHNSAAKAVSMARSLEVETIMIGTHYLDELLEEALVPGTGIKTDRLMSQIAVVDMPFYPRPLLLTDAYINTDPGIREKKDIIQNAVDLARACGITVPKVALVAASHMIDARLESTLEAAALCKMAERGQIFNATLEGPITYDMAVSETAAKRKGVISEVAGKADIAVCPNLESAHVLVKQLVSQVRGLVASIVIGARVPIILPSRGDEPLARLASCALAAKYVNHKKTALELDK